MKNALLAAGLAFAMAAAGKSSALAETTADAAQMEPAKLSETVLVRIKGMSCLKCIFFGFKGRLKKLPGVEAVRLDYKAGTALITLKRGALISPAEIRKAVKDAGFEAIEIEAAIRSPKPR